LTPDVAAEPRYGVVVGGGGGAAPTPDDARFERFTVTYSSGTVVPSFYPGDGRDLRQGVADLRLRESGAEESRVSAEASP
jgi:hypothetical protein